MSDDRTRVGSSSQWEDSYGYCRAVKVGSLIFVSGTTAGNPEGGLPEGGNDLGEQTRACFRRIETALEQLGASLDDVVRTRMFVTDISRSAEAGAIHGELFGGICPAATMVEVSALISPGLLIEVEVDAVLAG